METSQSDKESDREGEGERDRERDHSAEKNAKACGMFPETVDKKRVAVAGLKPRRDKQAHHSAAWQCNPPHLHAAGQQTG